MRLDAVRYLRRIACDRPVKPDLATLARLHGAHMRQVPFENLDIHLGRPIDLEPERLFTKIVEDRRGGFCYELNGLFAWLLTAIGFRVTLLSARVASPDGTFSPEFDHLTLRVDQPAPGDATSWIADVGFGDSFLEPLPLAPGRVTGERTGAYRLDASGDTLCLVRCGSDGVWRPQYAFTLQAHGIGDFHDRCVFQQHSPDSHFRQHAIATIATADGRTTISDGRLITTRGTVKEERPIAGANALGSLLTRHFGIVLGSPELGGLAARWAARPH